MSKAGKVFMLDDDHIFLELYRNLLSDRGFDVFTTNNAYKFLLYGRELVPDVMFLDINMPRMNGWEVLRRIASDDIMQDIPVVMLSAEAEEDLASARGVAHFLYKPVAVEAMMDILESYCHGNKNHDVLLIEEYEPLFNDIYERISRKRSCFATHNLKAAKKYLKKNQPKKICVRCTPERFEKAGNELGREDIYRVENASDIENLY